jgi:hypothetical protein
MKINKRDADLVIHALGFAIRSELSGADSTHNAPMKRDYERSAKRFIKLRRKLVEMRASPTSPTPKTNPAPTR